MKESGAMKDLFRVGGRLSLLFVVLLIAFYLGQDLYWEMQSHQRVVAPSDDPDEQILVAEQQQPSRSNDQQDTSRSGDVLSSNATDLQEGYERTQNASSQESLGNLERSSEISGNEQNPAGNDSSREAQGRPLHENLKRAIWEVPPAGSEMPALEEFTLRRETIEFRAEKNVIVVTFANHAFMGFVRTWVKSLTDKGVSNLLVGAMDVQLLEALYWAGIPTFDMGSNMKTIDVGWGSPTFHKMGREKVMLVNAFLSLGYELLMCDTDMVWLRNPLPYIESYPEADVLTSSDAVTNSVDDESLELWQLSQGAYNIGINHWRPTAVAKKFAAEWMEKLLGNDLIWDQNEFNDLMRRALGPDVNDSRGLCYAYDGTLKLGILPVSIFCSGHTYFVQALYKQLGLEAYAIHTTFQYAGTEGKRHRLREAKVFYDPPEYYDVPGGYISYTPSLPENLMNGGAHTVESHFALVNHQLVQVRTALAIASILNRTLVMPELWCRFDRMWYGHPGILLGTHTKQPFLCPMDHIFEVNTWLKDQPNERLGPEIRFREYSFLDNPQLPEKIKASTLRVSLCELDTPGCNYTTPSSKAQVPEILQIPMYSTEDQLKAALSSYSEAHVIEFSSMLGAFGNFSDETNAARFVRRIKTYTGLWCCVEDHTPGHIWYDIYWDKKPGWKPKPPSTPADDHQPL